MPARPLAVGGPARAPGTGGTPTPRAAPLSPRALSPPPLRECIFEISKKLPTFPESCQFLQTFGELVLGCTGTDFCE